MKEIYGNLWAANADALAISTNGFTKNDGTAVMGAGCAKEANRWFPGLAHYLGQKLKRDGNHVAYVSSEWLDKHKDTALPTENAVDFDLIFVPVKHHWREQADLDLIERSCVELVELTDRKDWQNVTLPRLGCGNGRLKWNYVKQRIEPLLDDRFSIITFATEDE